MKDNWKEELAKDNYGNPARSISNLRLIFTLDENLSQINPFPLFRTMTFMAATDCKSGDFISSCKRPCFSSQEMTFYTLIDGLSCFNMRSFRNAIPEEADEIIRRECSVPEDNPFATIEDVRNTALLLFAGYLDGATSMAASGGGGGSDMGGWGKDKDEDERQWARRCARMANRLCRRRKGLHR